LDDDEKELYKNLSKIYLGSSIRDLEGMCVKGLLLEVYYEKT
jgi:hypothetical protein